MVMARLLGASSPRTARSFYCLRYRLILVLLVFAVIEQQHLYFVYREALTAKYSPTEFPSYFSERYAQQWVPNEESTHFQDHLVANRAAWEKLGEGWEGKTFTYQGSVIKTFASERSPVRNCVPNTANKRWPTEIPASLHLGGFEHNGNSTFEGFLPVKAYFMALSLSRSAEWHLVTPLLQGGSIETLARRLSRNPRGYRQIDAEYRSAFERLLRSLQRLHGSGYCHDDIKPDNVYEADTSHWILGDLGNLRQVSHPYHTSLLWSEHNQIADCRANDVARALKSYMRFIRDSSVDADAFNWDFFEKREPLSRLFWSATVNASSLSATELCSKSRNNSPRQTAQDASGDTYPTFSHKNMWSGMFPARWKRHYAVNCIMHMGMSEKRARRWAMSWLFDVPVTGMCNN